MRNPNVGKKNKVYLIISIFCFFGCIVGISERNIATTFFYLAVAILFLYLWNTKKKSATKTEYTKQIVSTKKEHDKISHGPCPDNYEDDDEDDYEVDRNRINFSVAGVTYKNDDGTSRQSILRDFYDKRGYSKRDIELKPYKFENEDAIAVYAKGQMIGNVPREHIQEILSNIRTIRIYHFRVKMNSNGIYYSIIDLFLK